MTDGSSLPTDEGQRKTVHYRAATEGGLEAVPPQGDYRDDLRSRRWDAAPLDNPEVEKTDPRIAVAALLILAFVTFAILVVGYGVIGIWSPGA